MSKPKSGLLVVFKIMPEGVETDLDKVASELKNVVKEPASLEDVKVEPVAFGIKALKVSIIMPDVEGGPDQLEEDLGKIEGVESVQVTDMGRFG